MFACIDIYIYTHTHTYTHRHTCIFFSFSCFPTQLGSTAIGIQTNEGVVLAVEKRVTSPLIEPTSIEKIMEVDKHIGEKKL